LELAPKHLGKLVIQIEAQRDQVIAWLSTDNEQARSLLVQNAPLLRQQLQEQGLVLGQLQVSVGQEGREKNSQRQFEFSRGKGEGGRSMEKLQSGRQSGPTPAYRAADGDRRISFFA
jgi:flagellar hook-length control protein FliK